jgi:hypothetical protein
MFKEHGYRIYMLLEHKKQLAAAAEFSCTENIHAP